MDVPERAQHERARLSSLLRELRLDAGLSSSEAARRCGFSQSKLSKIENGMLLPAEADVTALLRICQATSGQHTDALALIRRLRNESESARVVLQRGAYRKQRQIGQIEAETTLFRDFQPTFVLGLLQTPAYMRRVFASLPAEDAERAVDARVARQRVLRDTTKRFDLVMTEGALRWRAGSSALMIEQLDRIAAVSELPNVRVGLVAWHTEVGVFPSSAFHLYDDRLAIVGTLTATATIADPRDVALYLDQFTAVSSLAVYGDEARQLLERIRDDYRASG